MPTSSFLIDPSNIYKDATSLNQLFANKTPQEQASISSSMNFANATPAQYGTNPSAFDSMMQSATNLFSNNNKSNIMDYDSFIAKNPGASVSQWNDYLQGEMLMSSLDQLNATPWMDYASIGLSAFDTFNQFRNQDEMLDYYRRSIDLAEDQVARSNAVKDSYSSAFSDRKY